MTNIFDFERLPVICLSKIADFLNTWDITNLLEAIYNCDLTNPQEWLNLYLFSIVFNPKQLNLEDCYRLKEDEFKRIISFFKKLKFDIESLNLNFCFALTGRYASRPKKLQSLISFSQLKSLTEFHAIDFELSQADFEALLFHTGQLKAISFTDNFIIYDKHIYDMKDKLNQIEKVKIVIGENVPLLNALNLFSNVISFEAYCNSRIMRIIDFSMSEKFTRIEEFIIGSNNLTLVSVKLFIFDFLKRLKNYHVYITWPESQLDENKLYLREHLEKFEYIDYCANVNSIQLEEKKMDRETLVDVFLGDRIESVMSSRLRSIEINNKRNEKTAFVLKDIGTLRLTAFDRLEVLDLASIHVHSTESICKLVAQLKSLKLLGLPCCSLAYRKFKDQYRKGSFMHALDDEEEEKEDKTTELGNFKNLKLTEFKLVCLNLANLKLDISCTNVEVDEMAEISEWTELKSLTLQGIKINGGPEKFGQTFEKLASRLSRLERLNLINLSNFDTYNYQVIFSSQLKKFTALKYFKLHHAQLFFDHRFLTNLCQITSSIRSLNLRLSHINSNLIKSNLTGLQKALAGLIRLEITSFKNTQDEIKFAKKSFKQVLPDTEIDISTKVTDNEMDHDMFHSVITIFNRFPTINFNDF